MNQFYPAKNRFITKTNILTVGLSTAKHPDEKLPQSQGLLSWEHFGSTEETKYWLKKERMGLPLMVFADYRTVCANAFQWVREFRKKRALQYVPVILLNCPNNLNVKHALSAGVDDWYQEMSDWDSLIARGRKLQRVRSQVCCPKPSSKLPFQIKIWKRGKRLFDIIASLSLILLSIPAWMIIAVLIKLESRGPVIYRSKRAGQHYRIFDFLKFRSMYMDADQRLDQLIACNQYGSEQAAFVKIKNDPRITKVGRIIRRTSLDELPQLLNVLKGDMSLVGNRPLPLYEAEKLCKDDSAARFSAPAGITGLWQVKKRGKDNMSVSERIDLDIQYYRKSSFLFDMKIVFMTLPAMLQHENV